MGRDGALLEVLPDQQLSEGKLLKKLPKKLARGALGGEVGHNRVHPAVGLTGK